MARRDYISEGPADPPEAPLGGADHIPGDNPNQVTETPAKAPAKAPAKPVKKPPAKPDS